MPDLSVDLEREVYRRRVAGQGVEVAARGENVYFLIVEVEPEILDEFGRLLWLRTFHHIPHPREELLHLLVAGRHAFLVLPVRRHAAFGNLMHLLRPNLDLHAPPVMAHDGRVKALVAV